MTGHEKLLLFDLDGTIIYSKNAIFRAINLALEFYGYEGFTEDELIRDLRIPLEEKYRMRTGRDPRPFMEKFREEYLRIYRETTYIHEGMLPLLDKLREKGITCVIVTLKEGAEARQVVEEMGLGNFFAGIFGSQDPRYRTKPSPEHVRYAMGEFKVKAGDCALIGDMRGDIMSAKGAGLTAIGVAWCLRSPDQLIEAGADHVATTTGELEEILVGLGFL